MEGGSQSPIEQARALYGCFERGEIEELLAGFADDFVLYPSQDEDGHVRAYLKDEYRGPMGLVEAIQDWTSDDAWVDFRFEPVKFVEAAEGRVLIYLNQLARGRASGVEVSEEVAHLVGFEDGKVVFMRTFNDLELARQAAGVPRET